jgi:hypothetical protein
VCVRCVCFGEVGLVSCIYYLWLADKTDARQHLSPYFLVLTRALAHTLTLLSHFLLRHPICPFVLIHRANPSC